jgi:hypothetical protein
MNLPTQEQATFQRDIEAKAQAHLDNLWEDYKIAANTYRRLYDTSFTGVPITADDADRILQAKNRAHEEALEVNHIYELAKTAYRAIGLTGSIGIHQI